MGVLLSPGMRVLSQFGFARKFALLLVLFILPLAVSLWLLGADFQAKLATVSGERSGVRLLQRLDAVEEELTLRRNLTARWKAIDTSRQETPAVQAAIAALESRNDSRRERLAQLGQQLESEGASADVQARFKTLQQALAGLEVSDLRSLGWWPDGYDRFTAALGAVQALREEIALDSGLILDPWMETYLLMQIGTTQSVELYERLGRLASVGQASVVSGQFSLQSRLQLRDLRARVGDSSESLAKVAVLLGNNWFVYIWAVAHERFIDASLGYFITPLVSVSLGMLFFRETLRPAQRLAIATAALGVAWLTWQFGQLPWVGLALAFSFGTYAALRKRQLLDAFQGLLLEQVLMLPLAAGYLVWSGVAGRSIFQLGDTSQVLLSILTGPLSAVPLLMFAAGARRIPLSLVGILQYISPTLQLLSGVLLWHEPFGGAKLVGYALIWLALVLYTLEGAWAAQLRRRERAVAALGGVSDVKAPSD